ncbi:coiled-coil domain-containing protein 146 isoform X6 [Columba livia]|uniref:coiled-coil domain-containing protein 146 isoform X6 n=1 Tax=Columba livia TaxID=8932 RepID=UPI0031BB3893
MSQTGEESSSSSDTESEIENEQLICTLAPTVYSRDEGSIDVAASPAFQCLDELFSAGKITDTRVAELKEKYTLLHKTVISLQESEIQLLQEAKRLSVELEQQQHELEKAEQFPEESSSEVSRIRQQLLSCQNEYNAIKEREYDVQFKMQCLQEEKRFLETEYERIPKQKDADKKIKQLKENCDELCKEVIQRKAEINALKEGVSSKQKLMLIDKKEVENILEKQANLKDELVKLLGVPAQLGKETEKINRKKIEALEDNLNKCVMEKKWQQDVLIQKQTQKDRELKNLKKIELQLNMIYDSLEQDKSQHKQLKLEAEAIPKSSGVLLERRRELKKEIEMIKRNLAEQEMISDMDAHTLEKCIAEEGRLVKEQEKCRDELSRLAHLTLLRVEEKERKCRELQKAQVQLQNLIKEIKRKDLEIRQCKKRKRKIQREVQGFSQMHDVIQSEKNKCINLVNAAQQKISEIKNQTKLLGNEIANLRNIIMTKERKLQKQHLKNKNNVAITDSLKNDCRKIAQSMHEMEEKKKQQALDLERLNNMVTRIEGEMEQLRKKYERAVQEQSESGLLLRDREEELCILYEKINMQEMLCRNGDIEIQVLDEKIRFLKLKVAEKKRQIKLWLKALPMKKDLDAHVVVLQIQYSQCKDRIKQMEATFTDPMNETRKRDLGGTDLSPPELLKKIEQLEVELVQKEEKLLEMDLLYEQVSQLTDGIRATAKSGKQDVLLLAQTMNELQRKLKEKTKQMMALVAELSMKQALAIKLQQEMRHKEQFLMTVSSRIDQGLPPPKETEMEWLKVLRNEKMQKDAAEARAKRAAEEEQAAGPGRVHTTAEQRPTAYIPDDEYSLPLPRPYGARAPFKPSEPGSNMRHFRKPVEKPIEI